MKEPTVSALAAASGITIVGGTILGLPADAILAGFGGGLVALSLGSQPMTWWRRALSVAVSTITAAYLAPMLAHFMPGDSAVMLKGVAFVVGAGAQAIIPAAINRATGIIQGGLPTRGGDNG